MKVHLKEIGRAHWIWGALRWPDRWLRMSCTISCKLDKLLDNEKWSTLRCLWLTVSSFWRMWAYGFVCESGRSCFWWRSFHEQFPPNPWHSMHSWQFSTSWFRYSTSKPLVLLSRHPDWPMAHDGLSDLRVESIWLHPGRLTWFTYKSPI